MNNIVITLEDLRYYIGFGGFTLQHAVNRICFCKKIVSLNLSQF